MSPHHDDSPAPSVLGSLRALLPTDQVSFAEARRIAEMQADALLALHNIADLPIHTDLIAQLPKITVEYISGQVSGASFWHHHRQTWVIQLSRNDSHNRQRFTLAHEYKHIIDHGRRHLLYRGTRRTDANRQAERAADYFAGCLLVPKPILKRVWHNGLRTPADLARIFRVSEHAIVVRLHQTRLVAPRTPYTSRLPTSAIEPVSPSLGQWEDATR